MPKDIHVPACIVGGKIPVKASLGQTVRVPVGSAVNSVNGMTGDVVLTAEDIGALPSDTPIPSTDGFISKEQFISFLPTDTASGAVASFTDGANDIPLESLVVDINPVQSGEGDPSPTNVRFITGWTGMTVNANGTEIPISWESEAGTVYGGTLDVLNGVLTVDRVKETFVFNNPSAGSIYNLESQGFTLAKRSTASSDSTGKITNVCGAYAYAQASWHNGEPHFYVGKTSWTLYLAKDTYRGENVELCYPLETPITYQLTPTEVKSLLGQNNIYADTGDTSVEYRADIKAYVNRKIAEAIAALS